MPEKLERVKIYTTAHSCLDLADTLCLDPMVGMTRDGQVVRLVHVRLNEFKQQHNRYTELSEQALCKFEWQLEQSLGNMLTYDDFCAVA